MQIKNNLSCNEVIIHKKSGNIIYEVEIMEKLVYSIQEVAALLEISRSYAYELARNGTIPVLELGNKRVIPKERFIAWVNGEKNEKMELLL